MAAVIALLLVTGFSVGRAGCPAEAAERAPDRGSAVGAERKLDRFGIPLVTIGGRNLPTSLVGSLIERQTGIDITFGGAAADARVTLFLRKASLEEVLFVLVAQCDGQVWFWRDGKAYGPKDEALFTGKAPAEEAGNVWRAPPERKPGASGERETDEFAIPLMDIRGSQLPTTIVTAQIKDQTGISVTFEGATAAARLSLLLDRASIREVLDTIVSQGKGWVWHRTGERGFVVMDEANDYGKIHVTKLREATFTPKALKPSQLAKAVERMLNKKIGESVWSVDRSNKVFVRALPWTLEIVRKYGSDIDRNWVNR